MPTAAPHICPSCKQPVSGTCLTCARLKDHQRSPTADRSHRHLYNSAQWKWTRQQVLSERFFCECPDCQDAALEQRQLPTVVHHIRPHGGDRTLFFDRANLQALAKPCHDRITGRGAVS